MEPQNILIKGARQHNLKNIDVSLPRNRLVVITGLSGSGKSSLAFDTLYAEGQRRYVESLSAYARQFLEQMGKPDVDTIEGLSPAISIEQKTTSRNPRSTVGTVTEIHDYLRLLFARIGHPSCYECGKEIRSQTVTQMVDQVLKSPEGSKIHLMAPLVRGRKGEFAKELADLKTEGFVRVRIDGNMIGLDEKIVLDKKKKHDIDLVVDRLVIKAGIRSRLSDSFEIALKKGDGLAKVEFLDQSKEILFSERFSCPDCGVSYPEISPRLFSFNNPFGACPECTGLGSKLYFDPELIVPDPNLSLLEGAIAPWSRRSSQAYSMSILETLTKHYRFDLQIPYKDLPENIRDLLMFGSKAEKRKILEMQELKNEDDEAADFSPTRKKGFSFEGLVPQFSRRYKETESDWMREELEKYMNVQPCPLCQGSRLKKEALAIRINGKNIDELSHLSISESLGFFEQITLSSKETEIAARLLKEIRERLTFLMHVGLNYLTLDRSSGSLSGGEGQRIRLATQIGSSLVGVLYILDEPSIGLHQRDNVKLIETLCRLRDLGNTVIVVEHDEETIRIADYVIDMGPGAGRHGGEVIASGTPKSLIENPNSITGLYLSGKKSIRVPSLRKKPKGEIVLRACRENNLKSIDVAFPLGVFICVTGVSGSGKSTLIHETLYKTLAQKLYGSRETPGKHDKIEGLEQIDKVIHIDQSPIGRTPRSNPATYTGLFTPIRDLFAALPESKLRGYTAGRFSFNVKGGRCEACEGDGVLKIEMHFLPDVYVECEECQGLRYNRETLEIRYKGHSIADILKLSVEDGLQLLSNVPSIRSKLSTLIEVGLGYVELGQAATTLSGGEAQRVKLAKELAKRSTGKTLYILDEPTTGLHFADIEQLLAVLHRFVENGNTVLVIEHNLDVIKTADYLIDVGPEGGEGGGEIVATGTPEEVASHPASHTGFYLQKIL